MQSISSPLFCITSDVDWASDYAIANTLDRFLQFGIKPTIFATHKSRLLDKLISDQQIKIGIHPNFLSGSTHGTSPHEVVEHVTSLYPQAQCYRSHSFFDNTHVSLLMRERGFTYDSNLCLHLQPNLVPLQHASGITRFPVFWEDDIHWLNTNGDWDLEKYMPSFLSPGLKILNIHPFFFTLNIPDQRYYQDVKPEIRSLNDDNLRFAGPGVQTFVMQLIEALTQQGHRFHTLSELHRMLPVSAFLVPKDESAGRMTEHSDEEFKQYWLLSDTQKQAFIKESYEKRNVTDPYATARDYNAKELEIKTIATSLKQEGTLIDLGCGNGHTLLSLAKAFEDWSLIGVDFSESLIKGANQLLELHQSELRCRPQFVCDDALRFIRDTESASVDCVLTERFIQNLPSSDVQRAVIREAYRMLRPGGRFLMCEGSEDGFDALNHLRSTVGLSVIPAISSDNVSAIRLKDADVEAFAANVVGFKLVQKLGSSIYFIIARVLHPLLVSPQRPRFDARINDLAARIQSQMPFQPGFGSNTLWVFEKPGLPSAREIQDEI